MRKENQTFRYREVPSFIDKLSRSVTLRHRMKAQSVRWDMEETWWNDLLMEFLKFPKGEHDDQVDACSSIFLKIDRLADVPTKKEMSKLEQLQKRADALMEAAKEGAVRGRSKVTGY